MVKRKEKDIKKGCMIYLKTLENQGKITWFDRLNSGNYFMPGVNGYKGRLIQGCRKGTPDAYCVLKNGTMVWLEFKGTDGKQSPEQEEFCKTFRLVGHVYEVIRSVDELINLIGGLTDG